MIEIKEIVKQFRVQNPSSFSGSEKEVLIIKDEELFFWEISKANGTGSVVCKKSDAGYSTEEQAIDGFREFLNDSGLNW